MSEIVRESLETGPIRGIGPPLYSPNLLRYYYRLLGCSIKPVPAKKLRTLGSPKVTQDAGDLLDAEWDERTWPSHVAEAVALDTQPLSGCFNLAGSDAKVLGDVSGVDARRFMPTIHNAFFVEGKVPSMNELLDAKGGSATVVRSIIMRRFPSKGKQRGERFDLYNELKQDWTQRTIRALPAAYNKVESAYFGYVVVEANMKRDPSNVCSAAIKFVEDGLVKAGVMPNDGWKNVRGIRSVVIHRPGRIPGIFVVMSDAPVEEGALTQHYEDYALSGLVIETAYGQR